MNPGVVAMIMCDPWLLEHSTVSVPVYVWLWPETFHAQLKTKYCDHCKCHPCYLVKVYTAERGASPGRRLRWGSGARPLSIICNRPIIQKTRFKKNLMPCLTASLMELVFREMWNKFAHRFFSFSARWLSEDCQFRQFKNRPVLWKEEVRFQEEMKFLLSAVFWKQECVKDFFLTSINFSFLLNEFALLLV